MTDHDQVFSRSRRRFLQQGATVGLAAASFGPLLAACGSSSTNSGNGSGPVTLQVWGGVPAENGPADLIAAFQKANPRFTIRYTRYVNDDTGNTKLDTSLQSGTPIDIYFSYTVPHINPRISAGLAEDLTPYINADSTLKTWVQGTQGIFNVNNKYFSLPTARSPFYVLANKKALDAAGATLPTTWSIDDYHTLAKKLSKGNTYGAFAPPTVLPYAPPSLATMTLGPNAYYKSGGTESNFDHPIFRQNLELHRGMITEKSSFPWTNVLAQNLRAYTQQPFLTAQNLLWITQAFSLRYINDMQTYPHDFLTTLMPAPVGASTYYNGGGLDNFIMMNSKSQFKDEAWQFIRFWLGDGAKYLLKGGKVPALPGTDPDAIVDGILGPHKDQLYDVAAFKSILTNAGAPLSIDTQTRGLTKIASIVQSQSELYLTGQLSADQWVTTVKQQADAAIQSAGA
jgi:multiple sugar transport system substrate-binding protein